MITRCLVLLGLGMSIATPGSSQECRFSLKPNREGGFFEAEFLVSGLKSYQIQRVADATPGAKVLVKVEKSVAPQSEATLGRTKLVDRLEASETSAVFVIQSSDQPGMRIAIVASLAKGTGSSGAVILSGGIAQRSIPIRGESEGCIATACCPTASFTFNTITCTITCD